MSAIFAKLFFTAAIGLFVALFVANAAESVAPRVNRFCLRAAGGFFLLTVVSAIGWVWAFA